jgi:hypothetical protein
MNKPLLIAIIAIVAVGGGYVLLGGSSQSSPVSEPAAGTDDDQEFDQMLADQFGTDQELDDLEFDERPAFQIYPTASSALDALRKGAEDYDDLVLEQFTDLGPDCGWCAEFYPLVIQMMTSSEMDDDTRSYFAEVLAISNRPENIRTLINAIENAAGTPDADLYAEALELTLGDDNIVRVLAEHTESSNDVLQEASVAAITNQGSLLAVQTLYEHTLKKNDPDGYYALGIGVGEVIPEREALPLLQEYALKRDTYSHLAVKSLLNYGSEGVRMVFDMLENSTDAEKDRAMLVDAIDHISYEDEVEEFAKERLQNSRNPVARDLAQQILTDFASLEGELDLDMDNEFDDEDYES